MQTKIRFYTSTAMAAYTVVLTLSGSPVHSQSYGDAANGKAFVQSNCSRCHAVGLNDDSHMPEAPAFRTLHNRYPIDSLAEAFAEGIVTGHPAMPQFELSIDTINDMLAYMKSLSGPGD